MMLNEVLSIEQIKLRARTAFESGELPETCPFPEESEAAAEWRKEYGRLVRAWMDSTRGKSCANQTQAA